jgi:hypothetical protein
MAVLNRKPAGPAAAIEFRTVLLVGFPWQFG